MQAILTINSGSSSLRFALYAGEESLPRILSGKFDRVGLPTATLSFRDAGMSRNEERSVEASDHAACIPLLLSLLADKAGNYCVSAIGHRVVHGGPRYRDDQRVDDAMLEELRHITLFAPNHLADAVALMEVCSAKFPQVPQIACFDTAFHKSMPRVAKLIPIPRRYEAMGVQRYGFHGLSYAYLMEELERLRDPAASAGRVILAHLGNGASMAAVLHGKCMDTSMGFTPAAGLVMGTRSGDLDPGLGAFLMRSERMTELQFDRMIHDESGLLGVSAISSDLRDLLALEGADVRAAEAVALFCYQAKKWIGSFAAVLGGLDILVFAGGIGENNPAVRARICEGLEFLGIQLNAEKNGTSEPVISEASGRVAVRVIRTDEEMMIARSVGRLLNQGAIRKGD